MDVQNDTADWHDVVARARSELDWSMLPAMRERLPKGRSKYLTYFDAEDWMRKLWKEVVRLGLHNSPPLSVLDLGAGPGYFMYDCRALGHYVAGIELDADGLGDFHRWMGLDVVSYSIGARERLPNFDSPFDLVTSFRVPFNKKRATREGGACELFNLDEWNFFLDDLRDNVLRPGGRFCMKMNSQPEHHVGPRYGDPKLMELFAARGATFGPARLYVTFEPLR